MRTSDARRGMTLIELMLSVAISSVILVVATALFTSLQQVKRDGERVIEVRSAAGTTISLIQFDAQNAGYRFSGAPFAVHVLQNVTGGESMLAPITSSANCGSSTWGIAPGTDVLELYQGFPLVSPGQVFGINCPAGLCSNVTMPAGGAPFDLAAGDNGLNNLVLFQNRENNSSCLGRITAFSSSAMDIQLLKQDLTNATATTYANCPVVGQPMTLQRLGRRVRYMVCAPPASQPDARPGLFRQESGSDGVLGAATLVQEGIEDLQIAFRVANPDGAISGAGCTGVAGSSLCTCGTGAACTNFEPNPTTTGPNVLDSTPTAPIAQRGIFNLRGITIGVTAISLRRAPRSSAATLETIVRPELFDHAAGTVRSGFLRAQQQQTILLENVSMVIP